MKILKKSAIYLEPTGSIAETGGIEKEFVTQMEKIYATMMTKIVTIE